MVEKSNKGKVIGSLLVIIVVIGVFFIIKEGKLEQFKIVKESTNTSVNNNEKKIEKKRMPPFKLKDMEGNEVTEEIFKDYDINIIIMWQTTSDPCYYELEALNEIYEMYKDKGVNVIGITLDDVEVEEVKKSTDKLELKFTNLMADQDYIHEIIKYMTGTPTTLFVDRYSYFLRDAKVGTNGVESSIEDFKNIIKELLPSDS